VQSYTELTAVCPAAPVYLYHTNLTTHQHIQYRYR